MYNKPVIPPLSQCTFICHKKNLVFLIYVMFSLTNVTQHACEQQWPQMRCCHWTGVFSCRHLGLSRAGFSPPLCLFSLAEFDGVCVASCFKCRGRSEGFSVCVCNGGQSREKECVNYYSLNGRLKEERLT